MMNLGVESHDRLAEIYDQWVVGLTDDADQAVRFIADLAGRVTPDDARPRLLELGVGSGRVALPLAAKGFAVTGIDASKPMLDLLRAKDGADAVTVVEGDFTELDVFGPFDVAFVVYNTLYCLPDQQQQEACVRNVAARLRPGGALVVQGFVPDPTRFARGTRADVGKELARTDAGVQTLRLTEHDPDRQYLGMEYTLADAEGERRYGFGFRYLWPAQLDLMAESAGLRLDARSTGWEGEPFDETASQVQVSVYRKAAEST